MPDRKIAIPDDVYDRVQKVANAVGATVDELVTKALERELARRWLVQVEREGQSHCGDLTDDEITPWSSARSRNSVVVRKRSSQL